MATEELPWELRRGSLSSFAHDSLNVIHFGLGNIETAARISKNSELEQLVNDAFVVGYSIRDVHGLYWQFRKGDEQPKDFDKILAQHKRLLRARNQKFNEIVAKIRALRRRNQKQFSGKALDALDRGLSLCEDYNKKFPLEQMGKRIRVLDAQPRNIYRLLKTFSKENFVDRDGNPVKVVLRGRDVGKVNFDSFLMWRSLSNLVTDALNHSPGRPIFVTLNARNGHAVINVTNEGQKLRPEEIAKIGRVRFTRAWHDPKRGYGKISTRLLTEAQGGTFTAGNSRIGPMLSIAMPRVKRARRI